MNQITIDGISFNIDAVKLMSYEDFEKTYKGKLKTQSLVEVAKYFGLKKTTTKRKSSK